MSHLRYATQLIWHPVHVFNIFFPANDVAVLCLQPRLVSKKK